MGQRIGQDRILFFNATISIEFSHFDHITHCAHSEIFHYDLLN